MQLCRHAVAGSPVVDECDSLFHIEIAKDDAMGDDARHVGHEHEFVGAERYRDCRGRVIPIHVQREARCLVARERRNDRHDAVCHQQLEQTSIDACGCADLT